MTLRITCYAVMQLAAFLDQLILTGAGADQKAAGLEGEPFQLNGPFCKQDAAFRYLLGPLLVLLFIPAGLPLFHIPVMRCCEISGPLNKVVGHIPASIPRHVPVILQSVPMFFLLYQVADRPPEIRLGGLFQNPAAIVVLHLLQQLHVLREPDRNAAVPDQLVLFQILRTPTALLHMPEFVFGQPQHLSGALFLPVDFLQLRNAAVVIAAVHLLLDPGPYQIPAPLYQEIFHMGTPPPQGQIGNQLPSPLLSLVQIQLAVFRSGSFQKGLVPGDNQLCAAIHILKLLSLPPFSEQMNPTANVFQISHQAHDFLLFHYPGGKGPNFVPDSPLFVDAPADAPLCQDQPVCQPFYGEPRQLCHPGVVYQLAAVGPHAANVDRLGLLVTAGAQRFIAINHSVRHLFISPPEGGGGVAMSATASRDFLCIECVSTGGTGNFDRANSAYVQRVVHPL